MAACAPSPPLKQCGGGGLGVASSAHPHPLGSKALPGRNGHQVFSRNEGLLVEVAARGELAAPPQKLRAGTGRWPSPEASPPEVARPSQG